MLQPVIYDSYESTPRPVSPLARAFPTTHFYANMLWTLFVASQVAAEGEMDNNYWAARAWWIVEDLEAVGVRFDVQNLRAYVDLDGPCVIIGNHMSTLETFLMPIFLLPHRPLTFVIKESLLHTPMFRPIMRTRWPIAVSRTNPRVDLATVLREGEVRLRAGWSVTVFPQTTRSRYFEAAQFNSIGIKLAKRAGVPVIPLALKTDAWGTGARGPLKDLGVVRPREPVRLHFGDPLTITGNGRAEHEAVATFIRDKLAAWGQIDPNAPVVPAEVAPASPSP